MSYREEMTPSSPPYSRDDFDDAFILRELSTPELEKRRFLYANDHARDGSLDIDGFDSSSFDTPWYRRRGYCLSLIRFAVFSIMIFISVAYYFWSIIPSASISSECRSSLSHSDHHADEPSDSVPPRPVSPPLCESPECVHAASEILYSLDPNYAEIDPCEDFEQYVCGGWRERHDLRPDQGSIFTGTLMAEAAQMRLRHILESTSAPEAADEENFRKLKSAYNACLDEAAISKRGSEPLDALLAQFDDIYSAESAAVGSDVNITDAVLFLMNSGVTALVEMGPGPDDRDPDKIVISVGPPDEIGLLVREYYNSSQTVSEYTKVLKEVLGNFVGQDKQVSVEDIVLFESKLANATPDAQTLQDVEKYYNPRNFDQIESMLPQISLSTMVSALSPADFKTDRLIVSSPSYMESLSTILRETPRKTIHQFFKWKIIQAYVDQIEDAKITPLREFSNKLAGKDPKATTERWRTCIRSLDRGLSWSLSRFYVLDAFSKASKELGDQIILDIKQRFVNILHQSSWMSPEVRKLSIEKVDNIVQKIGYPTKSPNLMDPADIERYYHDLHISNETFFENEMAIAKFDLHRAWSKLGKPTDRNEWGMSAPTVNAYYNPPLQEIVFPAGIMQPPVFYGPSAPLYLAYGAFGAVSGHELSHAFDSTGRHYDQTGNYTDWWDEKTVQGFEERAQCFVDQYSNFTVPGENGEPLHVNGRLTLGENIADAGGLGAAFQAWKKRDEASPDAHLPGLSNFSKEQLFFIAYGNWWCAKTTKEAAIQAIYTDPHAPKFARIIGTMANSREFNEAFNCPTKKPVCKLW
ncbi:M13 family metallopeptidase [Aspergillus fischeri NRRL 181]|uniref:Peptidase family M13 protein n=1 Tax=Neosartorya fischeri (strain ATCC 1020 / DSM 3700 / CBS 544.65 / FGSC A1164 / JCM 1740 / NRRL 181 / WB 181) TaxID=331117 RepID=A1D6I0_NEOFI|nr:peptidase family M13 protein [Aspergillus fischeri NRRL 181]EAW21324.1 peptidase family M13 protein [Aspergillus fischeri NRRL 181]